MTKPPSFGAPQWGTVDPIIDRALHEDLHAGDVTTRVVVADDAAAGASATIVAKEDLVLAGIDVARRVFARVDPAIVFAAAVTDGTRVEANKVVATITGPAGSILAAERTALNFLQRLCGVATRTRRFVAAAGSKCRVSDTRKTMPGLRVLDRYAVRCGGGHNHRNDLGSGVLIKENHIRAAGSLSKAVSRARDGAPHPLRVECEVTSVAEAEQAIEAGAEIVMLDNMDDEAVAQAVTRIGGRAIVEVSGGIDEARAARLGGLGVDVLSIGAITHSAPAADLSLLFAQPGSDA